MVNTTNTCDQCPNDLTTLEIEFGFTTCLACAEDRVNTIGANGNTGEHYQQTDKNMGESK